MNKEFHNWILKEWEQKGEPLVWESLSQAVLGKAEYGKPGSRMRLWEYEHGKHYVKNHTPFKDIKNKWYTT